MSNNTSLLEYYNYANFKTKHAPPLMGAQPNKRLLPEKEKDKINVELLNDSETSESPEIREDNKPGLLKNTLTNIGNTLTNLFKEDSESPAPPPPRAAPRAEPTPLPEPLQRADPLPVPLQRAEPLQIAEPGFVEPGPPGGAPEQIIQGGGGFNDMRNLMRKNRMLHARVQELEKELYISRKH